MLSIDLSGLGESSFLLHWRYVNDQDAALTVAFQAAVSLQQLISSIPGIGDTLAQVMVIDLSMQAAAGLYVDPDNWGIRFALNAGVGITAQAAEKLQVDAGASISGEVIIKGRKDGKVSLVFKIGDSEFDLQFCANDQHSDCIEEGYHCFGFFCRAPQERLGFCTHDIHCKSGHCMDNAGFPNLICGDCTLDEDCPDGFCEVNPAQPQDILGTCRPRLPSGEACDRDANCQSGTCSGFLSWLGSDAAGTCS